MLRREDGQTMAEYGVVLALVAIVTFAAYMALADVFAALLQKVVAAL